MSKKEIILATTLDLIADVGIQGTSLPDIIKKSGVAAGTIYYYFEGKEDLIDTLYLEIKQEASKAFTEGIEQDISFKEKFFLIWKNLCSFYINNPKKFELLEDYANSPLVKNEIKAITRTYYQSAIDLFESGIKFGILRDLPVNLIFNMFTGNISTFARMIFLEELNPSDQLLEKTIQASWDSIKIN